VIVFVGFCIIVRFIAGLVLFHVHSCYLSSEITQNLSPFIQYLTRFEHLQLLTLTFLLYRCKI